MRGSSVGVGGEESEIPSDPSFFISSSSCNWVEWMNFHLEENQNTWFQQNRKRNIRTEAVSLFECLIHSPGCFLLNTWCTRLSFTIFIGYEVFVAKVFSPVKTQNKLFVKHSTEALISSLFKFMFECSIFFVSFWCTAGTVSSLPPVVAHRTERSWSACWCWVCVFTPVTKIKSLTDCCPGFCL